MKIERLIGIITVLQQNRKVTAPELAEKFEVSRRTINRDIEDICRAGIPIVTTQGGNGGISLMEGFSFDTTVFTKQELSAIFTGLQTLDSVSPSSSADRLAGKIGWIKEAFPNNEMMIDLASFYKDALTAKIEQIKLAIRDRRRIAFHYYYNKGEADRQIEPYQIVFKWSDWYIFGFCIERQDFRMFKLRRLWELRICEEMFDPREIPAEKKQFGSNITDEYFVTAIFEPSVKYRLVEEYGPDSFTVMEDGRLLAKWAQTDPDQAIPRFLAFGDQVTVIDPPEMVEKMKDAIEKMMKKYQ